MPPPSNQNENQGLKIAVACLAMLAVILAVMTYFGFKSYGEANKKFVTAESTANDERKEREKIERVLLDVKETAGLSKTESAGMVKAMKDHREEIKKKVAASVDECRRALQQYKDASGGQAKIDELASTLDTIFSGFDDPAQTMISLTDRLQELLHNQAMIALNLGTEFHTVRTNLEAVNGINSSKLQVETDTVAKTKKDLNDEHDTHEVALQSLMAKVDALQSDTNKQAQEIASLKNVLAQKEDDFNKQLSALRLINSDQREMLDKKDIVLDKKDGLVTFVDYTRNEVRVNLTRNTGAREQMIMTIFDKAAPGIPTDKPKGTIELIQVGANGSLARILTTTDSTRPMRIGDQVYSSSWDANRPQQFALIGKIDLNRDGRDDRADLKRMIESAGGSVAYDLPPPGIGPETGKLSPTIAWYVIDDRLAYHPQIDRDVKAMGLEDEGFLKRRAAAISKARAEGIRPKLIERLLNELGYTYGSAVPGRVEAADRKAIEGILNPKGKVVTADPPPEEKKDEDKPEAEKPETDK